MVRLLRRRRGFPLLPHRLCAPVLELLRELSELAAAVAAELDDARWTKAADALERAAEALRDAAR